MSTEESILFCAFRYALGRMTYVVNEVATYIIDRRHSLSADFAKLVIREISEAEAKGRIGMDCDHEDWMNVRRALTAPYNYP
jgi:hypothetical protein